MSAAGDRLQDTTRRAALALLDVSHGRPITPELVVYKVAGQVSLIVAQPASSASGTPSSPARSASLRPSSAPPCSAPDQTDDSP